MWSLKRFITDAGHELKTPPAIRSSETGGHGIGLSIAKAVVLAHGGEITAASQDERSLTVTVILPIR